MVCVVALMRQRRIPGSACAIGWGEEGDLWGGGQMCVGGGTDGPPLDIRCFPSATGDVARSSLMNHSLSVDSPACAVKACWALTQADVLLCVLPIAVFLSIVSLV